MTTECISDSAPCLCPARCYHDFHEVRDGLSALEYIRRGLEMPGAHIDAREVIRALDIALLPTRAACERLGETLQLLED